MMHQEVEVVPDPKVERCDALMALEKLSERFDGSIVLRRYSRNTLLCDSLVGRLLGLNMSNGGYKKITEPLWIVTVKRRQQRILGRGETPEEAIAQAVKAVGGTPVW